MSHDLESIANALVAEGKGILAADETVPTLTKRFDSLSIPSTEQSRRTYREMLFTAAGEVEFISGVILQDETIHQKSADGTPLIKVLSKQGILPGIKVDTGAKPLAGFSGETVTEGLDGLRERLSAYRDMGARFAKWRAVIHISDALPSRPCMSANAHALARYAALCQEQDLVPIVEPEVLMDGSYSIGRCEEVTGVVLHTVFDALFEQRVALECMLLKPNMVISGQECASQASVVEVVTATLCCLRRHVPAAVPGIVFLSGGQADRGGHGAPERNQPIARSQAMEDQFLLRAGAPGSRAGGVAWPRRELGSGATSLIPTRSLQQRRQPRKLYAGDGDDTDERRRSAASSGVAGRLKYDRPAWRRSTEADHL